MKSQKSLQKKAFWRFHFGVCCTTVSNTVLGSRVPTNAGFLGVFSQSQFQSQSGNDVSKYVIRCGMILCEMHYN